jgi:hypothetical protein
MNRNFKPVLPLVATVLLCSAAFSASVHFKGGKRSAPSFTDEGLVLEGCVKIAGLGNEDVFITIEATGVASATCANPSGFESPGINKVPITSSATEVIEAEEIKNGNVSLCITTEEPGDVSAREAGCPNNNWDANIYDVEFDSVTVTVEQGGQVVLEGTFNP